MVRIAELRSSGLYSYREPLAVDVPDSVVMVGPNNSGKSNFFKMLKFFTDALSGSEPDERKISKGAPDPHMRLRIKLSKSEAGKIVDFFSFYDERDRRGLRFVEYENRARLEALLDDMTVRVFWKESADSEIATRAEIEFVKTGIKMYKRRGIWHASDRFDADSKNESDGQSAFRRELLAGLTGEADAKNKVARFFQDCGAITGLDVRSEHGQIPERGWTVIANLESYCKLERSFLSEEIKITRVIWAILERGTIYSQDGRHPDKPPILGEPKSRRADRARQPSLRRAPSKSPVLSDALADDGSNLSSFLLGLKTSPAYAKRKRFAEIQKSFESVFKLEKLKFDVILKNADADFRTEARAVQVPVTVVNEESREEFQLADAGSGVAESLYLLTLALGSGDSVILLDEPSLNMHPGLARAVLSGIRNAGGNQIMIATHSPEVVRFMALENSAGIFYVRKSRSSSTVNALYGETLVRLVGEAQLRYAVDPGIFFAGCAVLVDGDSDKNLLIGAWDGLEHGSRCGIDRNDVAVVRVGGKENFRKHAKMLDLLGVPYMILADGDAADLFEEKIPVSKETEDLGNCPVLVIENGDLEALMVDIDSEAYGKASRSCKSKAAAAFGFAEAVRNSEAKTKPLKAIFRKAAGLADGRAESAQRGDRGEDPVASEAACGPPPGLRVLRASA